MWVPVWWDNYKDYTYVGTLDGLYQHTLIATGTRLRPLQATFLGHILGTKPAKNTRGWGRLRRIKKWLCSSDLGGQTASGPPPYIQVGPPGSDFQGLGPQKKPFKVQKPPKLIILGLLKFVQNSPIKPVTGSVAPIKCWNFIAGDDCEESSLFW